MMNKTKRFENGGLKVTIVYYGKLMKNQEKKKANSTETKY